MKQESLNKQQTYSFKFKMKTILDPSHDFHWTTNFTDFHRRTLTSTSSLCNQYYKTPKPTSPLPITLTPQPSWNANYLCHLETIWIFEHKKFRKQFEPKSEPKRNRERYLSSNLKLKFRFESIIYPNQTDFINHQDVIFLQFFEMNLRPLQNKMNRLSPTKTKTKKFIQPQTITDQFESSKLFDQG